MANKELESKSKTRAELVQEEQALDKKQAKETKEKEKKSRRKRKKRGRIRLIPIWVRIILFVLFAAASLAGGLMVGYGIIGNGEPAEVLEEETWTHILDIIRGVE
ncbi:DNA-directed RNA polymerase subunit beta [Alkalihalobacillus sp. LMS39]|uniref:DNA-directed RNA polymerase subunit beta n=1 Tax=Alkalihalobacillus sp. LMS39 TaxID=2924032 RepID=UPI001FB52B34|nr:DNA-directed RNA polymerase subunit beta [Alkalihalobacillus sp. LMS39]UOE93892.1 DNA-directed RNA polymerase subunit beta [Alkalihalobacillus sp. LMS39]